MTVLSERTASPSEIAEEIGEPVNNVTYHIKKLLELGCIEQVRIRPASGGRVLEHFYRATVQLLFDDETWTQLGEQQKGEVTSGILRMMSVDITNALVQGTFDDPDDNHLSRTPMTLDPEGWEEVKELLKGTLEGLKTIQGKVVERQESGASGRTVSARVHLIHFRSPARKQADPD